MIFDKPSAKRFEDVRIEGSEEPVKDAAEIGKTVFQLIEGTESVRVVKHSGSKASVSVPDAITVAKRQYAVKEIGAGSFSGCVSIASVSLPDSIEDIGESAFSGCTGITDVLLPRSIRSIRGRAFSGCTSLTRITMPDSPDTIGRSAFDGCTSLKAFRVEKGKGRFCSDSQGVLYDGDMTSLLPGPYAMEGTVDVPPGVERLTDGSFSECSGVTSVRIPRSVKAIGDRVFTGCRKLALVYVDPGNTKYRSDLQGIVYDWDVTEVIRAPNSIAGALEIPNTVRTIRSSAFEGCTGLVSVSIPYSTVEIEDSAFEGCSRIRTVNMRGGVVRIGESAFRNCSGIITLSIPDSVEAIGDRAFYGCSRLNTVHLPFGARVGEQAFPANSDIVLE